MRRPPDAEQWWVFDPTMDREVYVRQTLEAYRNTPTACGQIRTDDQDLALSLYQKQIPFNAVDGAFVLATARRASRHQNRRPLDPIASLRYFLPIIREILDKPIDPADISYLWLKMQDRL